MDGAEKPDRLPGKKSAHKPLIQSFGFAFQGIGAVIRKERNFKIHMTMAVMVVLAGIVCRISVTEWCICLILFCKKPSRYTACINQCIQLILIEYGIEISFTRKHQCILSDQLRYFSRVIESYMIEILTWRMHIFIDSIAL